MELKITSPAFDNEGWISNRHSGFGEDFSPELRIENTAENAVSLAITLDDLSHPIERGYNHWLAWNMPVVGIIPENLPKGAVAEKPFHIEQGIGYGKHSYRGPKPPFNWNHRYCFTVYVLDTMLEISTDSDKAELLKAMDNHILQSACLYGKYQKKHK